MNLWEAGLGSYWQKIGGLGLGWAEAGCCWAGAGTGTEARLG